MNINLSTQSGIKEMVLYLNGQGFSSFNLEHHLISSKINSLAINANTLKLSINYQNIIEDLCLIKIDSFIDMKERLSNYFARFSPQDKIFEFVNSIHPCKVAQITVPYKNSMEIENTKFVNELAKYNIQDVPVDIDGLPLPYFNVYRLMPGEKIKVVLNGQTSSLEQMIKMIYGKDECLDIHEFDNGNADLKGDIEPLRQCYIKYLRQQKTGLVLITENGVQTINDARSC